jgi:signal recognition particle subunit SRP54
MLVIRMALAGTKKLPFYHIVDADSLSPLDSRLIERIAAGSGTSPEQINKLLKMHRGMADMMKAMGSGKRGPLAGLGQMMGFGGGMPSQEEMQKLAEQAKAGGGLSNLPPNFPGLPGGQGLPGQFPGLGGKFPGPGGLPGFGKKK